MCEELNQSRRLEDKLAFLGSGIIAEVWMTRLLEVGAVTPEQIMACDVRPERLAELSQRHRVQVNTDNAVGTAFAQLLILAPPPSEVLRVLRQISKALKPGHLIISLAAGVSLAKLEQEAREVAVVRVMPNTAALVGEAINLVAFGTRVTEGQRKPLVQLLDLLGEWFEVADEQMDAWCALCAVGPTYIFPVIDALASAASSHNLPTEKALYAAAQVVAGAARLSQRSSRTLSELKQMISLRTLREDHAEKIFADAYEEALTKLSALTRKLAA